MWYVITNMLSHSIRYAISFTNLTEVFHLLFIGFVVTEEQLEEVAELSDVLSSNDDYLPSEFRAKCEVVIEDPLELDVKDFSNAFRYLKENIDLND